MAGIGESWENLGQLGNQDAVLSLLDLKDGKVLAGTHGGGGMAPKSLVYRSIDYGDNWTDLGRPVDESYLYCFAHLGWGIIVAGTGTPTGKVIRSVDYGLTWTDEGQLAAESGVPSIVSLGGGIGLAGTSPSRKIFRTIDYGDNWTFVCQIGAGGVVHSLINLGGGIVIAGTTTGGGGICEIYRSINSGDDWTLVASGYGGINIYSLVYLGNGIVLAGTDSNPARIIRSTDYGATWTDLGSFAAGEVGIHSFANLKNGIVVAGTNPNGKILRSIDYSINWTNLGQQYGQLTINSLTCLDDGRGMAGTSLGGLILRSLVPGANGNGNGDGEEKKPIILTHWVWKAKDGSMVDAYYSPIDTRCRLVSIFYDGRILSCSPVARAIDDRTGLYSISDINIELANHDMEFSKMLSKYFLKNQLVEIFHAWCDEPEAWKRSVFQGIVVDHTLKGTSFFVTIRDVTQKYFKAKVPPEICT